MKTEQEIFQHFNKLFNENKLVGHFGVKYLDDKLCGILKGDLILIGARSGCVDSETEFFSQSGWKKISEYKEGDIVLQANQQSLKAELVKPIRYIKEKCDKWYHFTAKYGLDMKLSSEHEILYKTCRGNYTKDSADSIARRYLTNKKGFNGAIPTIFDYEGKGIDLSDSEIKLMLAVIADGSFINKNLCVFHIKKDRKKQELLKILKEGNFKYHWYDRGKNGGVNDSYSDIRVYVPRIEKYFTKYWYDCNKHQLEIICNNVLKWDGNLDDSGRKRFSTTIKESADFIQFAFSSCGYKATIHCYDRRGRIRKIKDKEYVTKSIDYNVQISDRKCVSLVNTSGTKENLKIIDVENEYKYCFEVPSHCLVLRRNGKIFVTGNSGKSTLAEAIARKNAESGVNVTLFSLENFKGDNLLTCAYYKYKELTQMWNLSQRVFVTQNFNVNKEALKQAELYAYNKLKNINFVYRQKEYTREDLKDGIIRAIRENKAELLIIDHIDYLDKYNKETEIEHITSLMKEIREAQLVYKIPVICISHLRKNGTTEIKIPSMDEFIGSSNKAKISTVSILFAPDDVENVGIGSKKATWCCIRKLRMGGYDNTCARLIFDKKTGEYENNYELYKTNFSGTKVELIERGYYG